MDISVFKEKIFAGFPDFKIREMTKVGEGMDSTAFLVNRSLIFRFPKHAQAKTNLQKEIRALPILNKVLDVAIPNFEFVDKETNFVGYRQIEGEFLTRELFESLTASEQREIQKSLANFLIRIHEQDIEIYKKFGVKVENFRANYENDVAEIKKNVFPLISAAERDFIEKEFDKYLQTDENFSYAPVLLHADLSPDHILIDRETKKLTGIIDFGDIGIGDGDYDLMYLLDDYGEDFIRSFLQFYPHDNHFRLFDKLYFWALCDVLQLIDHYQELGESAEVEENKRYLFDWINKIKSRLRA